MSLWDTESGSEVQVFERQSSNISCIGRGGGQKVHWE